MALNKNIKDLRVLQIVPQIKPGGVERGVLEIFRFLSQNKIKSFIFCESIDLGLLKKSEENYIFTTGGIKFKDIKKYFYLNLKLKKIINDYRINLIHITSRAPAIIFYNLINQNPKIRYITSLHNPYQGSYFKKYYNSFLLKGDAVIANSNYTKKFIEQNYKLINNIISIPRGVDLEYFNPNKFNNNKKIILKKKYKINQSDVVITMPSRFSIWKGHEEVILFFNKIFKKIPYEFKLIFFVDSYDKKNNSYIKKICSKELLSNTILIPYTPNIEEIYALSDIIINNSSKPEGFGRTISESLAMNVVPIGTNHGGVREQLIKFNKNLLYRVNDHSSFLKALRHALKLIKSDNFNGRKYIKENYSLKKMLRKTLQVYLANDS